MQSHAATGWIAVVRSIAVSIEASFPSLRDPLARPESRLAELLTRLSARELVPQGNGSCC